MLACHKNNRAQKLFTFRIWAEFVLQKNSFFNEHWGSNQIKYQETIYVNLLFVFSPNSRANHSIASAELFVWRVNPNSGNLLTITSIFQLCVALPFRFLICFQLAGPFFLIAWAFWICIYLQGRISRMSSFSFMHIEGRTVFSNAIITIILFGFIIFEAIWASYLKPFE